MGIIPLKHKFQIISISVYNKVWMVGDVSMYKRREEDLISNCHEIESFINT